MVADFLYRAWSVLGPLVGIAIGSYLTTHSQKTHWVLDNRRAEYRKLLSTLTRSYSGIVNIYSRGLISGRDELKAENLRLESLNVIRDRIFIAKEVGDMGLLQKWASAGDKFLRTRDYDEFAKDFSVIADLVRRYALEMLD